MNQQIATEIMKAQQLVERKANAVNAIASGAALRHQVEKFHAYREAVAARDELLNAEATDIVRIIAGRELHTFVQTLDGEWTHGRHIA